MLVYRAAERFQRCQKMCRVSSFVPFDAGERTRQDDAEDFAVDHGGYRNCHDVGDIFAMGNKCAALPAVPQIFLQRCLVDD